MRISHPFKMKRGEGFLVSQRLSVRQTRIQSSMDGEGDYDDEASDPDEDEYATYIFEEDDFPKDESDPSMRLYLDSADYEQWKKWADTGMFYGFTTNPTILRRDGVKCTLPSVRQLSRMAFELGIEELQLQAWGETMAEMYSCALDLAELDTRVVVKVPMTMDGIQTARRLVNDEVPLTFTAVYSVHQAVTALSIGAQYIAPYLGRMQDAGKDALHDIAAMQGIVDMSTVCSGEVRLLVASIRDASEIATLAAEGCNTFTISPSVAEQLVMDPLTDAAAAVFEEHAREMGSIGG
jgi:transaldolase